MNEIKFGTDGWRGVIADDFTLENVDKLVCAVIKYFNEKKRVITQKVRKDLIVVGYDNRFLSPEIAGRVANMLSMNGYRVMIAKTSVPTPAVSLIIKLQKALGGIIVTASHNPYKFNGIKLRSHEGVSISKNETAVIESFIGGDNVCAVRVKHPAEIEYKELRSEYISYLRKRFDNALMRGTGIKVVVDSMHGSGAYCLEEVLKAAGIKFVSIRSLREPVFGMVSPEPIESNLQALRDAVKINKADIGIAFDGDADRIGMMDSKGNFINSHHIFALLLLHLVRNKKLSGRVVKTISGSYLIDRICGRFNMGLVETPVGFKYISEEILKGDVLIGGEESGGLAFNGYLEERDGIFSALMMLEYIAMSGRKLDILIDDLHKEYGNSRYVRKDMRLKRSIAPSELYSGIIKCHKKALGRGVKEIKDFDGIKFIWEDGSWLLIRASGTEPVLRLYAEHSTKKGVVNLLKQADKIINMAGVMAGW